MRRRMNRNSPIFEMESSKDSILHEVAERTMEKLLTHRDAQYILNDAAYKELLRLHKTHPKSEYWQSIYKSLNRSSEFEQKNLLKAMIQEHAQDIIGRFDPSVYRFATSMVPHILGLFLDPQLTLKDRRSFNEKVLIEGHVETARRLSERGTVILVPTHSSNMDSILAGWSAYRSGLPPVTYGAGKNLFTNRMLSFFMHNLGAYRLDRRLKHELYKTVLKTYSLVILERGFHSLFFPGGTRSRSGAVEQKLKLGLIGTGLEAYINNLVKQKEKPNIYLLPITINYYLVLEAETLINDYLKEQGKSRYIIEDDESSQLTKTLGYMRKTLNLDASVFMRYAPPMDIFGNQVDDEGLSYDDQGRVIDPSRYVKSWDGEILFDDKRDQEYMRDTGRQLAASYMANNVILSPHLVSFLMFRYLVHHNPNLDLYQLIRIGAREAQMDRLALILGLERFKRFLMEKEEQGILRLANTLRSKAPDLILDEAVQYMQMFYSKEIVLNAGERVRVQDMRLLYYYHNRLSGYGLESAFAEKVLKPALAERGLSLVP